MCGKDSSTAGLFAAAVLCTALPLSPPTPLFNLLFLQQHATVAASQLPLLGKGSSEDGEEREGLIRLTEMAI